MKRNKIYSLNPYQISVTFVPQRVSYHLRCKT